MKQNYEKENVGDFSAVPQSWFPGHMMKTLRMMETEIHNVDAVLILLDARIPFSSINPEVEARCGSKPKLYLLNKADLADPDTTAAWVRYFHENDAGCVAISSKNKASVQRIIPDIDKELTALLERRAQKGQQRAKIRLMVVGIPNVGKSTFINTFTGTARAKAADKPGVTRGKQWISCERYDLLDMPGVLWTKFDTPETATNLAFIGSISDGVLNIEEIACDLIGEIKRRYPEALCERYRLKTEELNLSDYEILELIGLRRGMLIRGGEIDTERAAIILCDEFRASKLGRISLEHP